MINLLPPSRQQQIKASKENVVLRHYILLCGVIMIFLFGLMYFSYNYANKQISKLNESLTERQQQRQQFNDTEKKVSTLQKNISLIEKLLVNKTEFSTLLQNLASVLPNGAYISKVSLTGDEQKPVELLVNVNSLETAGILRNALNSSDKIKSVDIQSVSKNTANNEYVAEVVIAFEDGATR